MGKRDLGSETPVSESGTSPVFVSSEMEYSVDIAPPLDDFRLPLLSGRAAVDGRCVSLALLLGGDRGRLTFVQGRRVLGVAINCRLQ